MDNSTYIANLTSAPPPGFTPPAQVVASADEGIHTLASLRPDDRYTRSHLAAFVMNGAQAEQRFSIRSQTTEGGPVFQIWMGGEPANGGRLVLSIDMSGNVTIAGNLTSNTSAAG